MPATLSQTPWRPARFIRHPGLDPGPKLLIPGGARDRSGPWIKSGVTMRGGAAFHRGADRDARRRPVAGLSPGLTQFYCQAARFPPSLPE